MICVVSSIEQALNLATNAIVICYDGILEYELFLLEILYVCGSECYCVSTILENFSAFIYSPSVLSTDSL